MTDPFRLRAAKALTAVLQEITPDNGYVNDLSASVFRGRSIFGSTDPVTMVSILEPHTEHRDLPTPVAASAMAREWEMLIQGFVKDDPNNPTDPAHTLAAEVCRRLAIEAGRKAQAPERGFDPLGMNKRDMKNRVEGILIGSPIVRPADEISNKAYFWTRLTLKIVEDISDPFG
ncbi:hypothetical protein HDIA_0778 [Hartmannibacter diazotrophicus]|uniref:Uncharacterized protein n=1 Tax=Hartmannibacter diazotrophicus TaxID=1482074 RepID=A0A2C9D2C0_9HYPH|nr:hypothetical protein [Hartmannibacter diazotrophicus]SON54319.1 hypothetical protein HDIA_0778 [Hartmannibacter diazotrophicus]